MQFRHEVKHEISYADLLILRGRLKHVMKPDKHAKDGSYTIRSLYFDNIYDKALKEKINGVNEREKYRLRIYNGDTSLIRLERKYKNGALGYKNTAFLTKEQAEKIIHGDVNWMPDSENSVITGFYTRLKNDGLKPCVIVDYTREPFVFAAGNVRVTLDYEIRTGLRCTDFLNPSCTTVPIKDNPCILEVKWDSFLPDIIRDTLQLDCRRAGAFSKYAACRMYE